MFKSTKTYGNDRGLSCCFRQWKADSHCKYLHGYSLGFRFKFEAEELDERNWVYDFGNCKWIKSFLEESFDHKLLIARDDPHEFVLNPEQGCSFPVLPSGVAQVRVMDGVGCEMFAKYVWDFVGPKVHKETDGRVTLRSVECFEHGSNSAKYKYDD